MTRLTGGEIMSSNAELRDDVIFLKGRIDSNNADETADVIRKLIIDNIIGLPVFDASELKYISSAGLRILLGISKRYKGKPSVINVSKEVYDVLDSTGFTELLDVRKAFRRIETDDAELVGKGSGQAVYRLDNETAVKVYHGIPDPLEKIERDRKISRTVFTHGINTAMPYDTVRVGDDYGVVYEMIDAETLGHFIDTHPDRLEEYTHKFTRLLKHLHTTEFSADEMPDARELLLRRIDACRDTGRLTAEEIKKMKDFTERIPEKNTFVHGDLHPGNIMLRKDELILLDVGESGVGHPIIDFMGMHRNFVTAAESGISRSICGLDRDSLTKMWDIIIEDYFGTKDAGKAEKYKQSIAGMATLITLVNLITDPSVSDDVKEQALPAVKASFFNNTDKFVTVKI